MSPQAYTEKAMAPLSSTLAWKIPWMEEPGRLQSMGPWRVGHDWATSLSLFTFMHWRRKWQPTPVFLPGESQGQGSLVGCRLWGHRVGHDWSDLAAAAAASIYNFRGSLYQTKQHHKYKIRNRVWRGLLSTWPWNLNFICFMFCLFLVMLAFLLFQQSVVKTSVRLSGKYCNAFPVEFLHRFPSWNIDAPFVLTHPQDSHWLGPFMWLL